jgi:Trk K+ transport system NAD-binding subunit
LSLKAFGVPVRGIDLERRESWHSPSLPEALEALCIGDCRYPETLRQADLATCRTVVIVTSDERVNVATAMAVRSLEPRVRIVIRSGRNNLNRFLATQLGDFVAFEPILLSAPALALAALGDETLGLFRLEGETVRVRRRIPVEGPGRERALLELNTTRRRVLHCEPARGEPGRDFHEWAPGEKAASGDVVTFLELGEERSTQHDEREGAEPTDIAKPAARRDMRRAIGARWAAASQVTRVAIVAACLVVSLYTACALLYRLEYPEIGVRDALNVATVLILGGFDNLFGQLRLPFAIPLWLHAFSVLVSVSGTVAIGTVYAFITERVLSVRFQLFLRRPRAPKGDHVVLVGLGPLADEVAEFLARENRPLVALTETPPEGGGSARFPVIVGPLDEGLERARVSSARSVMALSGDDVANLEAALTARAMSPRATLVIRADDARFRRNVAQLIAGARALGVQALAAEVFAAAALGENVHQLLHLDRRTFLVTEYQVDPSDTLHDRLVAEVAYGFGVLPLLLVRGGGASRDFLPSDDLRLRSGDRFVVLASLEGLRRVESNAARAPTVRVRVDRAASEAAAFDGALAISKVSGCDVAVAQVLMRALPAAVPAPLYAIQADRLVRELAKVRVVAHVAPEDPAVQPEAARA